MLVTLGTERVDTNRPAYSDLLALTGELLIMKKWLPLLRD